jgi:hypothetical protein
MSCNNDSANASSCSSLGSGADTSAASSRDLGVEHLKLTLGAGNHRREIVGHVRVEIICRRFERQQGLLTRRQEEHEQAPSLRQRWKILCHGCTV